MRNPTNRDTENFLYDNEIFCPDCEAKLTPELVQSLLEGYTVYCEMCGFPFVGIVDGEVKPLKRDNNQKFDSPVLSKKEKQWIKWKKTWQIIKGNFPHLKENQEEKENLTKLNPQSQIKESYSSFSYENLKDQGQFEQKRKDTGSINQNASFQKTNGFFSVNFNLTNQILSKITPFYYIFIILITINSLIRGNINWLNFIGFLVLEIFIIRQDLLYYNVHTQLNQIEYVGIPMIVLGLLSFQAFGIGIPLCIRGVIFLLEYIQYTKLTSPRHPAVSTHKITNLLWIREVIRSIGIISSKLIMPLFFLGLCQQFTRIIYLNDHQFQLIWVLIAGIGGIILFKKNLQKSFLKKDISDISLEIMIFAIILGIFTLNANYGHLILIWGILNVIFREINSRIKANLPATKDLRDIKYVLIARPNKKLHVDSEFFLSDAVIRNFDPKSGKKIHDVPFNLNLTDTLAVKEAKEKQQIYTILDPSHRSRLLKLKIDKEDKDIIARSLIYMNNVQRDLYLEELEMINNPVSSSLKYTQRIRSLPISEVQQNKLVDQLQYLPPDQQQEFVDFLEQTLSYQKTNSH